MVALPSLFRGRPGTVSDVIIDTLLGWGVDTVFGLPGDGINGIFESMRKQQAAKHLQFVQVRHEEAAAFMATGYAKYTGRLGVCVATSGPGAIHLLNGLYDAKLDGAPVLAITGQTYSDLKGSRYQQEVNLLQLFSDVASVYNETISVPDQAEMVTNIACRSALAHRAPVHITIPVDVQEKEPEGERSSMKVKHHTSAAPTRFVTVPCAADIERAVKLLDKGKKIVVLVGQGALDARNEVIELAERLGAPVVKALLGKGVIPDLHPLNLGGLGLLGTRPAVEAMEACDTLLMIGTSFPYMKFLPQPGQARGIQVDIHADRIGLRYPVEVGLVGDARATCALLAKQIRRHSDHSFLRKAQNGMKEWRRLMDTHAHVMEKPMKPQVVAHWLSELAPDDCIVSTDSGTITTWIARHFQMRDEQMFSCSGNLATMAGGLPYTIAAAVAWPKRKCIAFVGDGGFTMLMGEFATAVKYNLPITVFVIKNNTLGQIKWEQMVFLGNPEFAVDLQPIDFVAFARACGGEGFRLEDPRDAKNIVQQALRCPKPCVVECVVDPFEPPLPPKVKPEQALHLAESLARGEPNRRRIALTIFRDKLRDFRA